MDAAVGLLLGRGVLGTHRQAELALPVGRLDPFVAQTHGPNDAEQDPVADPLRHRRLGTILRHAKRFLERNHYFIWRADGLKERSNVHRHRFRTEPRHVHNGLQIAVTVEDADSARLTRIDADDVVQFGHEHHSRPLRVAAHCDMCQTPSALRKRCGNVRSPSRDPDSGFQRTQPQGHQPGRP